MFRSRHHSPRRTLSCLCWCWPFAQRLAPILQCDPDHCARPKVPALPESLQHRRKGSAFVSFNFELSTINCLSLSPFPATLTDNSQLVENSATLSLAFAALTDHVKHKSFACHSYKKHRGWGQGLRSFASFTSSISRPATRHSLLNAIPFRITFFAHPHLLTSIESHSYKKQGRGCPWLPFRPSNSSFFHSERTSHPQHCSQLHFFQAFTSRLSGYGGRSSRRLPSVTSHHLASS